MKTFLEWLTENKHSGNYVSVDVSGMPLEWATGYDGTVNTAPHITLIYSENSDIPLETVQKLLDDNPLVGESVRVVGVDMFDSLDKDSGLGCVVLTVESDEIAKLHQKLVDLGMKHSYEFTPHATLIYDCPTKQCVALVNDIKKKDMNISLALQGFNNDYIDKEWVSKLK